MAFPTERTVIKMQTRGRGYGTADQSPNLNFITHDLEDTDTILGLSLKYGVPVRAGSSACII